MAGVLRATVLLLGLRMSVGVRVLDATACSGEELVTSGARLEANYSALLACGDWTRAVTVADGYQAELTVRSLLVAPGDYLVVSPGGRPLATAAAAVLVGRLRSPRRLRALGSPQLHLHFHAAGEAGLLAQLEGFSLAFGTDSPLTTTQPPTPPPSTLPSAPPSVADTCTVFLRGRSPADFLQYSAELRTSVKEMAQAYCREHNISVLQDITEQNVVFRLVERCALSWPDSQLCTRLQLAVPVDTPSGYQLTASSICAMWEEQARGSARLAQLGLQVYDAPDAQVSMLVWLGVALGVTLVFTASLLVAWRLLNSRSRSRQDSTADSRANLSEQSWLDNLPHQQLPITAASGVREFEPDSMHLRAPLAGGVSPAARPHVPVPDSKPLPEYGATLLFGRGFDKQALMEVDEGVENNVSVS
ncbi:uncharacterized protein LOC134539521 [Bacillus rossius redtenbacheri]|uniref:uncharacterized protein LOC134539521 n=1 Tax=Bacillus rossius redtenbacheri TaxID=93214 RepID=UPI002FDE1D77